MVGRRLLDALRPLGARALFAGSFPRLPARRFRDILADRRILAQFSLPGWVDQYEVRDLDRGNPVILATPHLTRPFSWSDGGLPQLRGWAGIDLAREIGAGDGIAVPVHRPCGRIGVVSVAFERLDLSPAELERVHLAALVAYERMEEVVSTTRPSAGKLSRREKDCIAFVGDGLSDGDIAARLGLSPGTVHSHIENAKRKLGARTRAQAAVRFYVSVGGIPASGSDT